jgi:predicted adenylyl cyclase CyaB
MVGGKIFMRNVELKIKLENDHKVKSILKKMGAVFEGELLQRDTFYSCPNGRLKLRQINDKSFQLIFYNRPDVAGSKISEYWITGLDNSRVPAMEILLIHAFGEETRVNKKRQLWLYKNARIHIDHVTNLGLFLELETAVDDIGMKAAREEHKQIIKDLGIDFYIPLHSSYADMFIEENDTNRDEVDEPSGDTAASPWSIESYKEFQSQFLHVWNVKARGGPYHGELNNFLFNKLISRVHFCHHRTERITDAFSFAVKAHKDQVRKGTQIPYIEHPLRVAKILIDLRCPEDVVIAALLHDTVEHAIVNIDDIRIYFGENVASLVERVSEPDKSAPWEDREQHTIVRLKNAPEDALLIACADKLENLMEMRATNQSVGADLWKQFYGPKEKQESHYRSLAEVFTKRMTDGNFKPLLYAYLEIVKKFFG